MRVKNSFTTVHAIPSASVIAAGQLSGGWRWAARGAADGHGECPLARVAAGGERQRTAGRRQVVVEGRAHPARQTGGPEGHLAGKAGVIVLVLVLLEPEPGRRREAEVRRACGVHGKRDACRVHGGPAGTR